MKMNLKVIAHQRISFQNKWLSSSAVFAGVAFFFLIVNYLGVKNLLDVGFGEILFLFLLPMTALGSFIIMIRVTHYQVTPVYGILGSLYCLSMLIRAFSHSNIVFTIISAVFYFALCVVCIAVTFGYTETSAAFVVMLFIAVGARILFVDLMLILRGALLALIPEISALCAMTAFALFGVCLSPAPIKDK